MTAPIRVAVAGLGWAGRSIWLPRLAAHPAFTVTAAIDPAPGAAARLAAHPALAVTAAIDPAPGAAVRAAGADAQIRALTSVDQLDPALVDLAVVAVPNNLHAEVACRLLRRGIPVFLEKPVCLTTGEADQLAAAERAGGAMLLAGSAARYRADVRAIYELAATLGPLRHIDISWVRARGVPAGDGWFTDRRQAGGGALVDLGWHLLDTLQPLLDPGDFDQVAGTVSADFLHLPGTRAGWRQDDPTGDRPSDVEDTARGFLVTSAGVSVSLRASWASHEARDVTVIRVEGGAGVAALRCTFGFSPNRPGGSALTVTRDGETTTIPVAAEPIGEEYRHQLDQLPALLGAPQNAGRAIAEAHRTIDVIERVYRSAGRRRVPSPAL